MRQVANLLLIVCLVVVFTACESRTDRTDSGGVLLSITDFDGLPLAVSVNSTGGFVTVEEVRIANVSANPNGSTSDLMNVEMVSYEVEFSRADRGTRIPTKFVRGIFGVVPVGGEVVYEGFPIVGPDQLSSLPLSDLLWEQGGTDQETGEDKITLNLKWRFFGRTLSGDAVETVPALFTVDFTP